MLSMAGVLVAVSLAPGIDLNDVPLESGPVYVDGILLGLEMGDFLHAVILTDEGDTLSFFVFEPFGIEYYLAATRGDRMRFAVEMSVVTDITGCGDEWMEECVVDALDGASGFAEWLWSLSPDGSFVDLDEKFGEEMHAAYHWRDQPL